MLPPNPNECNSTLTSGTRGYLPPLLYWCWWAGSPLKSGVTGYEFATRAVVSQSSPVQSSQCGHSQSVSGAQISNRKKLANQEDPRTQGGTPILGHIRDMWPEWVSFSGRKPADVCKFFTKNLRMGHSFDIILPGNGWFSSKPTVAWSISIANSLRIGLFLGQL